MTRIPLSRLLVLSALFLTTGCDAQTKPGGMQSGTHTAVAAAAPAPAAVTPSAAPAAPAAAVGATTTPAAAGAPADKFNVPELFAGTCGWCHSSGGREAGKGPKLMDSALSDGELIYRIKNGKVGQMPSFSSAFNDDQMKAIVVYIRNLKPEPK